LTFEEVLLKLAETGLAALVCFLMYKLALQAINGKKAAEP